ncbi:hypothetical protein V6N13_070739 [Hibiscus sabdariffa]
MQVVNRRRRPGVNSRRNDRGVGAEPSRAVRGSRFAALEEEGLDANEVSEDVQVRNVAAGKEVEVECNAHVGGCEEIPAEVAPVTSTASLAAGHVSRRALIPGETSTPKNSLVEPSDAHIADRGGAVQGKFASKGRVIPVPTSLAASKHSVIQGALDPAFERSFNLLVKNQVLLPEPVLETLAATPPPESRHGDDVPGWRWDEKRLFRVSSAYAALLDARGSSPPSVWNKIWSLQVPQRVRIFMWITAHKRHLTNAERFRRHIANSETCGICQGASEDIDHVLRFCTRASTLWRCVLGRDDAHRLDALPFEEWLHGNITGRLVNGVARDEWGMRFSIYCWLLWKRRCSIVLDTEFIERESVLDWATRFIEDCNTAFNPLRTAPRMLQSSGRAWEGPPIGWVKGNVDAAVNVSNGRAAVGGVFRDADVQGESFRHPPVEVIALLEAEQQHWEGRALGS